MEIQYARIQLYKPFVFGGSVWEDHAYPVEEFSIINIGKFECFVFSSGPKNWSVHEKVSGGLFGSGTTKMKAIGMARKNVKSTPDLHSQVKKLTPAKDLPKISHEDAIQRLAKRK